MRRSRGVLALASLALAGAFALSGCVSLRYTNSIFDTGRTLDAGKNQVGIRGLVYPGLLPVSAYLKHGFPGGWQVTAAYGIHGLSHSSSSSTSSGAMQGPELAVTKQFLKIGEFFYLGASGGADIDITPQFTAMLYAGLDAGLYPTKWLSLYAQAKTAYILSGSPGILLAAGLEVGAPFTVKLAGFYTPVPIAQGTASSSGQIFVPVGVMASLGYRF